MAQNSENPAPSRTHLDTLLDRLFAVKSRSESRQLIEANPELLSAAVDERITARFQDLAADGDAYFSLILHQQFLSRCRDAGLDAAFADLMADLPPQDILPLLNILMAPGDEPRRILLTHRLLATAPLDRLPALWSLIVDDLGKSLLSTRAGLREANVERAIVEFVRALTVRTRHEMPLEWAETLSNLAMALRHRVRGDRTENVDKAIAFFEQALEVQSITSTPASFIRIRRFLVETWAARPRGDREDNLDHAIRHCQELLSALSPEASPIDWANVATDLASLRLEQRRGDPLERMGNGIAILETALALLDPESSPQEWARTATYLGTALSSRHPSSPEDLERVVDLLEKALTLQRENGDSIAVMTANNLAKCYMNRVGGDRAENLERALELFEEISRPDGLNPPDRRLLHNLAVAYAQRVTGDQSKNIERAISVCERALDSATDPAEQAELGAMLADFYRDLWQGDRAENHDRALSLAERAVKLVGDCGDPRLRLKAHYSLGAVYLRRARGDQEHNLRQAAEAYERVLQGASPDTYGWAQAQTNLARVYIDWPTPDRAEKIELAIACCTKALGVLSRESEPFAWADTMHALADAYNWRVLGDRAENLEKAIEAYRAALEVRTADAAPNEHLETLNQLAGALRDRRHGERQANLFEALNLLRKAVKNAPEDVMPGFHRALQGNIGRLLFYLSDWRRSAESLQAALRAGERLYRASATPEGKLAELREALEYPPRIAYSLAKLHQPTQALEALENNRARLLAETLDLEETAIQKASEADRFAFEAARRSISRLETEVRALEPGSSEAFVAISGKLREAQKNLAAVVERVRSYVPDFLPAGLDLPALSTLTRRTGQPLVFLASSPHGSLALAVAPGNSEPETIWLDATSSFDLRDLLFGNEGEPGYIEAINSRDTDRIKAALGRMRSFLENKLINPLAEALTARGLREITLVPCGTLGLLPLPALLSEHLAVSLIPSGRAWKSVLDAASTRAPRGSRLLAVDNPDGTLPFSALEVDAIAPLFSPTLQRRLSGRAATRSEVIATAPAVTHFHFGCHGAYETLRPLESTLTLAGSEPLKVRDLLDGTLDLSASKLVVLSACETGIFDIRTAPDEILGFPASFLQAGAPAVISTLWRVSDASTSLLLGRFYTLHLKEGLSMAEALRQARLWLRDATVTELGLVDHYREVLSRSLPPKLRAKVYLLQRQAAQHPDAIPFADPYYWAPFVLHGVTGS